MDPNMNQIFTVITVSWLAGITAFLGGVLAKLIGRPRTTEERAFAHGAVAFGGGLLVAAIAFALTPEGIQYLSTAMLALTFCAGGLAFCIIDAALKRSGGTKAQFMAMLMDFVPEAIAMGAVFAHDHHLGLLLGLFIGAQNLPEGYNAFREFTSSGLKPRSVLAIFAAISLLGPLFATGGYFFLQNQPAVTASIMTFAAGGILYLVFQDIAPQSMMRRQWAPPLGAVLGFVVGMIGKQLLG
jgi:ZIP family zinc transporter